MRNISEMKQIEPFAEGFIAALCPELILFAGLIALIILPNLGKGTFRIPGTQKRVMWLLGGDRFRVTSNPKLPAWIATVTLFAAFIQTMLSFQDGVDRTAIVTESGKQLMLVNGFSRVFELIFFGALTLAAFASMNRLEVRGVGPNLSNDDLYNNRRQAS